MVLERPQEFLFFPLSQVLITEIPVGQEFLYLPQIPTDSSGFFRIFGTTNEGILLSTKSTKLEIRPFKLPNQD